MRSRIVTSPAFNGRRVLGAILFEVTMDRQFDGIDAADYLLGEEAGRAVPEGRQGPGRRGRRRAAHEADARTRRTCSHAR